jgi:hypothetical protein
MLVPIGPTENPIPRNEGKMFAVGDDGGVRLLNGSLRDEIWRKDETIAALRKELEQCRKGESE